MILGRRAQGRSCAGITEGLAWPLHSAGEPEGIDLTGGAAVSATSEASDAGSALGRVTREREALARVWAEGRGAAPAGPALVLGPRGRKGKKKSWARAGLAAGPDPGLLVGLVTGLGFVGFSSFLFLFTLSFQF